MAALLAASVAEHAPAGSELIAAVPQPAKTWGHLDAEVLELFHELGVRMEPLANPLGPDRSHANKIFAHGVSHGADRLVFLDSDTVVLDRFTDRPPFAAELAAKPADMQMWTDDPEHWRRTFAACGAPMPTHTVTLTVSGESSPPCFNSGVLVSGHPAELAEAWAWCARRMIDAGLHLPNFPWTDQPSLSAAIQLLGLEVAELAEDLNYPGHRRPPDTGDTPTILHYHRPARVANDPAGSDALARLTARHPALDRLLRSHPEWSAAVEASTRSAR